MQSSDICRTKIMGWEGFRASIYPDANGFPTIGYGHKLTHAEVVNGTYANGITMIDAQTLFDEDIAGFEAQVAALSAPGFWTQGQFDALTSFDYNLGINDLKVMLSHGLAQVPQQIPRWCHAGGVVEPGLVSRRAQEVAWWNS